MLKWKHGKIKVNVKSITGYKEPVVSNNTVEDIKESKDVKVKIVVGEDVIFNEKVNKSETNLTKEFKGIGTVTIKVYLDDVLGNRTYQLNLNEKTTLTVE